MNQATKLLWAMEPTTTLAALISTAKGKGQLLFVQLDIQRRLDRASPYYEPVAERIFLHLLGTPAGALPKH